MTSKYRDFSDMPAEALDALARDLANPKEALQRIRKERRQKRERLLLNANKQE